MVDRIDSIELRAPHVDDISGNVTVDAYVTKVGVFAYKRGGGRVTRELRHPDDVFAEDSMESLRRISVTDEHPPFGAVTTKNAKYNTVGFTGDIYERVKDKIRVPLTIIDEGILAKMRTSLDSRGPKKREVSCGYKCNVVEESGTYNGEPYDHRQKNIRYNHIAVTNKGRQGDQIRVRMDSDAAVADDLADLWYFETDTDDDTNANAEQTMSLKIKHDSFKSGEYTADSFSVTVPEEAGDAVEGVISRLDSAHEHIAAMQSTADRLTGERDAQKAIAEELQTKLDAAEKGPSMDVIRQMSQEYAEAKAIAKHLKLDVADDLDIDGLHRLIVQSKLPELKEDASDEQIMGSYAIVKAGMQKELDSLDSLAELGRVTSDESSATEDKHEPVGKGLSPRERFMKTQIQASK